jgi:hypothetical protein
MTLSLLHLFVRRYAAHNPPAEHVLRAPKGRMQRRATEPDDEFPPPHHEPIRRAKGAFSEREN